jgi:hypothetical protein
MYLGCTAFLDRRLRRYSLLALTKVSGEPRDIHRKIAVCVEQEIEVAVLAKVLPNSSMEGLESELDNLIGEFSPIWNTLADGSLRSQSVHRAT